MWKHKTINSFFAFVLTILELCIIQKKMYDISMTSLQKNIHVKLIGREEIFYDTQYIGTMRKSMLILACLNILQTHSSVFYIDP